VRQVRPAGFQDDRVAERLGRRCCLVGALAESLGRRFDACLGEQSFTLVLGEDAGVAGPLVAQRARVKGCGVRIFVASAQAVSGFGQSDQRGQPACPARG
jgi:hypothetical protein